MLTFILFIIVPIFLLFIYLQHKGNAKKLALLAEQGINTDASINSLRKFRNAGSATRYYVTYQFSFSNHQYQKQASISKDIFSSLTKDGTIKICFLKSNPEISHPFYMVEQIRKYMSAKHLKHFSNH